MYLVLLYLALTSLVPGLTGRFVWAHAIATRGCWGCLCLCQPCCHLCIFSDIPWVFLHVSFSVLGLLWVCLGSQNVLLILFIEIKINLQINFGIINTLIVLSLSKNRVCFLFYDSFISKFSGLLLEGLLLLHLFWVFYCLVV